MNRLKQLRAKSGITLRELSKYVNIRNASLSLIENGKQPMREIHVLKLTSFFDVTSDYLLGYSSKGIGIYFKSNIEEGEDHAYISASELEKINERHEIKEVLVPTPPCDFIVKTNDEKTRVVRTTNCVFRYVDIPRNDAHISTNVFEQINEELSRLEANDLEKVLKFIREYIK